MFADIRDTLSFSADLLRDVTAQHIYDANVDGRPQGSGKYQKRGRAASGAHDGGDLTSGTTTHVPAHRATGAFIIQHDC